MRFIAVIITNISFEKIFHKYFHITYWQEKEKEILREVKKEKKYFFFLFLNIYIHSKCEYPTAEQHICHLVGNILNLK